MLDNEWIESDKVVYGAKRLACADRVFMDVLDHARQSYNNPREALSYAGHYRKALRESRFLQKWAVFIALVRALGDFYIDRGEWSLWRTQSEIALASPLLDDQTLSDIQRCRCRLFFRLGDYGEMERALDEAEAAAARGGFLRTAATLLYLRGALNRKRRNYNLARRFCRESVERWRELGDRFEMAIALYNLGAADDEDEQGDLSAALRCFEECLRLFRETRHPDRAGRTLLRMGRVFLALKSYGDAAACVEEAERLFDPEVQPREWANLLHMRARVEKAAGHLPKASSLAREAISLVRQLGMKAEEREIEVFLSSLSGGLSEEAAG